MRSVLALCVMFGVAANCGDDRKPPVPNCRDLGCDHALCNHRGECTCNGQACTFSVGDAGVDAL